MADLSKTIEIIFGATDNTAQGISSVADNLNNISTVAETIATPLAKIGEYALKADAAVLALGATFLTIAVNEASKFGEKVEEIGSLVNNTAGDNQKLSDSIFDFAQNVNGIGSSSSIEQINDALYNATSNAGNAATALDLMATSEKGAQVGATGLNTSTSLLTGTMNAYGLITEDAATNTENAERVMAAMFTTVQNGKVTMTELSANMGEIASTAAGAKVPVETIGAAIAALTSANVDPDQAFTSLNRLLIELITPADNLKEALGGLSVVSDGLPAVMDKLKQSTGGTSEEIYKIFTSSEAAKAALILTNDSAGKFDSTLAAMSGNVKVFDDNYRNMVGGVADSSAKLGNSWTELLVKIGKPLQDSWAGVLESISNVSQGFKISISAGAFDPAINAFKGFENGIADILNNIAENLPEALGQVDFAGLVAAFQDLGFEIGGIFDNIDLTTPRGLADVIQLVVDDFKNLIAIASGIVETWSPIVKTLFEMAESFGNVDSSSAKTFGNLAGASQIFLSLKGVLDSGKGSIDIFKAAWDSALELPGVSAAITTAEALVTGFALVATTIVGLAVSGISKLAAANPVVTLLLADIAALTFAVTENKNAWDEYNARQELVAGSAKVNADNQSKLKDKMAEINSQLGVNFTSVAELNTAMDKHLVVMDKTTGVYSLTEEGLKKYNVKASEASESSFNFADAVNAVSKNLVGQHKDIETTVGKFNTLEEAETAALKVYDETGRQTFIRFADGLYNVSTAAQKTTESSKELAKQTDNAAKAAVVGSSEWKNVQEVFLDTQKQTDAFTIAMGELAEQRYEVDVKANVDLRIAEIEATTQRISAAFQATGESISSLVEGVSDLWGTFAGSTSRWDQSDIKDAALRQEARLDDELDLKRQMTAAVVSKANAEATRLNSGEPLISIDAGELAPELYLVLDKILKYTQIKGTQEGLAMLVGL